ncbi:hypothetical protein AVEN_31662-1, partial [Araneus ventricosus]
LLRARPKSLAISTPTKLLSLEEARARALSTHLPASQQKYIEVGGGPEKLPSKYHTVIELPPGKQGLSKLKKSPSGWKSFFSRGWYSGSTRDKSRPSFRSARKASTGSLPHHSAFMQEKPSTDQDTSFGQRKKLRTVKSAESLAHCLKESLHSTNKDDFSGNTSCKSSPQVSVESSHSFEMSSPLSKSPGLQKHTRSSSHESYFESNSMDIISEPSFEEDEHGLFYYVSEQMRMLQDSSRWSADKSTLKDDSISMKSSEFQDFFDQRISAPEAEKNVRKQKLSTSDEFAQTKYQKLNETDQELKSFVDTKNVTSSSDDTFEFDKLNSVDNIWQAKDDYNNFSPETEDLTLDPILLYEAVINKRSSAVTSSDTENEPNDRTVVERYGNAETVLVEVHATQDSSSEEEHYSPVPNVSTKNAVLQPMVDATFDLAMLPYSPGEEIQDYKLNFSDEDGSISPSNRESEPTLAEETTLEANKIAFEIADDRHDDAMSESEVLPSCETQNEFSIAECNSSPAAVTPVLEVKVADSSSDNLEDIAPKGKPIELNFGTSETIDSSVDEFDNSSSFSIISPPSPVYPPKSLKLHEFQSLKTKMDKLPLHKKKQIHIPSPSSPVDEVRKKFELRASSSSKSVESPTNEIKFRSQARDLTPKLVKAFEVSETVEVAGSQQISANGSKTESMLAKRHSEPPTKTIDSNTPTDIVKRMSNKYENEGTKSNKTSSEKQATKPKPLQPSLFTQLKIRKLQSLKAEPAPEPVDPWSDPILDMQEDYHPIVTYLPSSTSESDVSLKPSNESSESDANYTQSNSISKPDESKTILPPEKEISKDEEVQLSSPILKLSQKDLVTELVNPAQEEKLENTLNSEVEIYQSNPKLSETPESEAVKRERINRIKEERRAQLREKLKQESFRMEAEEKEKVQTKFRLRKDSSKHHLLSDSQEEHCKDVKKSDKAVETDSADIAETGTNCDLSSPAESLSNTTSKSDSSSKSDEDVISRCRKDSDSIASRNQKCKSQQISSGDYVLLQNKSNSGKKSMRSYEDSRKWLSMPPTDIRDKVAMFERSKDTNELCRLGPNGKFPQKQSPSALASSFVR